MFGDWIRAVMMRDLRCLKRELEAYPDERDIWKTPPRRFEFSGQHRAAPGRQHPPLHRAQLGHSSYKRDRDAEFNTRDMPRAELIKLVDMAIIGVEHTLPVLKEADFAAPYGLKIADATITTGDFWCTWRCT